MRVPFRRSPIADTYAHIDPDKPGYITLEKVFDREPALRHCEQMRQTKQTGELRKVMSVPTPLLYQWMREGKLGAAAFYDGKLILDIQTLQRLMRDVGALKCIDKL